MKQITAKFVLTLALGMSAAVPAAASEQDAVMKTVRQLFDGFNKGDMNSSIAACARDAVIIDEIPPHAWYGENTCERWAADLIAFNETVNLTDTNVTLKKPRRVDITGDRAYVVVPADFTFKENGKDGAEIGALVTLALHKESVGWRIKGWTWSRP